jgi:hypothetical protein
VAPASRSLRPTPGDVGPVALRSEVGLDDDDGTPRQENVPGEPEQALDDVVGPVREHPGEQDEVVARRKRVFTEVSGDWSQPRQEIVGAAGLLDESCHDGQVEHVRVEFRVLLAQERAHRAVSPAYVEHGLDAHEVDQLVEPGRDVRRSRVHETLELA